MVAKRIADVALRGIVLIERIVLNGVNIGKLRDRQTGTDAAKHGRDHGREQNFTEVAGWIFILVFKNVWMILEKVNC